MITPKTIQDSVERITGSGWARFNQMSPRQRRLLVIALVAMGAFLFSWGVAKPIRKNVQDLDSQIKIKEKLAAKNILEMSKKPGTNQIYFNLVKQIGMPLEGNEEVRSKMLEDLDSFARDNSLSLTDIKPQISAEKEPFVEFSVRAQAEGTMPDFMKFMCMLMRSSRLYSFETLRINSHNEDVNKVKVSMAIKRIAIIDRKN